VADAKEETPTEAPNGSMVRTLIVGAVFLGIGAGGATILLPSLSAKPADVVEAEAPTDESKDEKADSSKPKKEKKSKSKSKAKNKGKGKGSSTILDLNPMVVSLYSDATKPNAVPRMRLSVSVDTGDAGIGDGTRQKLRHAFIGAVQTFDASALRGPEGLDKLTEALRGAATEALGVEVSDVYITEFIVL